MRAIAGDALCVGINAVALGAGVDAIAVALGEGCTAGVAVAVAVAAAEDVEAGDAVAVAEAVARSEALAEVDSLDAGLADGACATCAGSRTPDTASANPAPAATPARATMAATAPCCGELAIQDHADLSALTRSLAR